MSEPGGSSGGGSLNNLRRAVNTATMTALTDLAPSESQNNMRLAVNQHASGVTGDQTSPWTRAANTPSEMLGVGSRWAHSVGQTRDAWANINKPAKEGDPPPTKGQVAARALRATQQTVGAIMGGLGLAKEALDVGFANLTAPLAAIFPALPAATLLSPYLGTPHCHPTHPPSGPPPIPPTPLPSLGMVTLGITPRVLINSLPAARCDDIGLAPTCCGIPPAWFKIKTGSSNVFIGGSRAARLGDVCQACKNIPEAPTGMTLSTIGKIADVALKAMAVGGVVAGALGIAADVAEAAVEDDAAMASAKALSAAMASAQMAADAAKMAVEKTMWKDPTLPPTGSVGAIIDPSHVTVLIGGFPMINIPNPVEALLNRLKYYKAKAPASNEDCGEEGEPINVITGANLEETLDFQLDGELPFLWKRFYDSAQSDHHGPFGWGYRHSYQRELYVDVDGYCYIDEYGASYRFPQMEGDQTSSASSGFVLRKLGPLQYRLDRAGQPTIDFVFEPNDHAARPIRFTSRGCNLDLLYDELGRLAGFDRSNGDRIRIRYNDQNLIARLLLATPQDKQARIVAQYTYDDHDNLICWMDTNDHQATFEYDSAHRMTRKGDRCDYSYHYEYDKSGRCVRSYGDDGLYDIALRYFSEIRLTEIVYASGATWLYFYDENGTITRIVDPYGSEKKRTVDDKGRVVEEIDPNGNITKLLYNSAGGFVGRCDLFGNVFNRGDDLRRVNTNPLIAPSNSLGWCYGTLVPSGESEDHMEAAHVQLDAMGRIVEEVEASGRCRRFTYDQNGNRTGYTDGDGRTWSYEYTSWNLLRREVDPLGSAISYRYNDRERIAEIRDAGGTISRYVYDFRDRLVEVHRHGKLRDRYIHDRADNLVEKYDGEGNLLLSFEIGSGNLKRVRRLASGETHYFDYDQRGRITRAATDEHEVILAYDIWGKCCVDQRDGLGLRRERLNDAVTRTIVFGRFSIQHRQDSPNRRTIVDPTGAIHEFTLDSAGNIVARMANGTTAVARFDSEGRCLVQTVSWVRNPNMKWERSYGYSKEGLLLRAHDGFSGEREFSYDACCRLIGETLPDKSLHAYSYDLAGNLLTMPGLSGVRMDSGNRLIMANGDRFIYNSRDHIAKRESKSATIEYEYDSCDRLVQVRWNGKIWRATYDPLGRRISKGFEGENPSRYYWDDNRIDAEIAPDGCLRIYLYSDVDALVPFMFVEYDSIDAPLSAGRCFYVFSNQIGVPIRIEDGQGWMVWEAKPEPYGRINLGKSNKIEYHIRFPGHWEDPEIGLFYNRFRYYSPELGRYLQSDPWGVAGGVNLYTYLASPLTDVDLFGLHPPKDEDSDGASKAGPDKESAKERMARKKQEKIEEQRQKTLEEAVKKADASGKLDKLSPEDRAWLESDPRHKLLAIDPDGSGGYRIDEAKTALQAEQDGHPGPFRRATEKADSREAGADFVDGNNKAWDHKDASMGADDIASTANNKENVLVDSRNQRPADQKQLQQDVNDKLKPDASDVVFVPKR